MEKIERPSTLIVYYKYDETNVEIVTPYFNNCHKV